MTDTAMPMQVWVEARQLARGPLAADAAAIEAGAVFPRHWWQQLVDCGLVGLITPLQYNGGCRDTLTYSRVLEELAWGSLDLATVVSVHGMVQYLLLHHASADQQAQWLPRLARGEAIGAFAMTEPDAGSDSGAIKTTALQQGDHYLLNGGKSLITSAGEAGLYLVVCRTPPRGTSILAVAAGIPGFKIGPVERKMACNGFPTAELVFDNCQVPVNQRIGAEGNGMEIIRDTMDHDRISVAALALGVAQGALDAALGYARDREQFGRKIADFQGIQFLLADQAMILEAARSLVYRAARRRDSGQPVTALASMAKTYATDVAMLVTQEAVQVLGAAGCRRGSPVERYFRQAKGLQLVAGANQVQRIVIARELLRGRVGLDDD